MTHDKHQEHRTILTEILKLPFEERHCSIIKRALLALAKNENIDINKRLKQLTNIHDHTTTLWNKLKEQQHG